MGLRTGGRALTVTGILATAVGAALAASAPAWAVGPVNPVLVDAADPVNAGFLVFVERDAILEADESEGTMAIGGDVTFRRNYNILRAGSSSTPQGVALYVGGGLAFPAEGSGAILRIIGGQARVMDDSTYDAFVGGPGAVAVPPGESADHIPRLEVQTSQTVAEFTQPVPEIDVDAAFSQYRTLSTEMGECVENVALTAADGTQLVRPVPSGNQAYVSLTAGTTNVLNVTAAELDGLTSLTFNEPRPGPGTPLVINVSGDFDGSMPNLAGVSSANAAYMLWNFPDATDLEIENSDSLEGTIYAPRADLDWYAHGNIEGNVIARSFDHLSFAGRTVREVHDFPFRGVIDCESVTQPTGGPTSEPTTEPTTEPSSEPTTEPTVEPTTEPTAEPTTEPTAEPTTARTTDTGTSPDGDDWTWDGDSTSALPDAGGPGGAVLAGGLLATGIGLALLLLSGRSRARRPSAPRRP